MVLDGLDELGGFEQGFMGTGVEPGVAAAEDFDVKVTGFHVRAVDTGDFEFAARRGFHLFGDLDDARIVKVEVGDGELRGLTSVDSALRVGRKNGNSSEGGFAGVSSFRFQRENDLIFQCFLSVVGDPFLALP